MLFLLFPIFGFAGDWNTNKKGVVLDGYDVVSYRTEDRATKGSTEFVTVYGGATFHFFTKKHLDMFVEKPE